MYVKIENNQVVYPPKNDGNVFNVNINVNWLISHGYEDLTEEQISSRINNVEKTESKEFDPANYCYSRRGVILALDEMGLWDNIYQNLTDKQKLLLSISNDFSFLDPTFKAMYDSLITQYPNLNTILENNILSEI